MAQPFLAVGLSPVGARHNLPRPGRDRAPQLEQTIGVSRKARCAADRQSTKVLSLPLYPSIARRTISPGPCLFHRPRSLPSHSRRGEGLRDNRRLPTTAVREFIEKHNFNIHWLYA